MLYRGVRGRVSADTLGVTPGASRGWAERASSTSATLAVAASSCAAMASVEICDLILNLRSGTETVNRADVKVSDCIASGLRRSFFLSAANASRVI